MKSLFRALVAMCAMSMASGVSAGVIVGDKEWRQVTDTVFFTWTDFSLFPVSTNETNCGV